MRRYIPFMLLIVLLFLIAGCEQESGPEKEAPLNVKLAVAEVIAAVGVVFEGDNFQNKVTNPAVGIDVTYDDNGASGTATVVITSYSVDGGTYTINGTIFIDYFILSISPMSAKLTFTGSVVLTEGDVEDISADFSVVIDVNTGPNTNTLNGTMTVDGTVYDIVAFKDFFVF
jgi:hypothetical protein